MSHVEVDEIRDGKRYFASGSTRTNKVEGLRYDLISPYGLRALSRVYGEGAVIHGDRNWEKGQPEEEVLNHAIEHLMKYLQGEKGAAGEDNLAKIAWAMFALIHFRDCPGYDATPQKNPPAPDWEETG